MLNQKQAFESVKSSLHSKNLKNSLLGNIIKSKLYFLILLTATTGGICTANIIMPELVPPAQAYQGKTVVITRGNVSGNIRIHSGQTMYWKCSGATYGNGFHVVKIRKGDRLVDQFEVNYNGSVLSYDNNLNPGRYVLQVDNQEPVWLYVEE